MSTHTNSRKGCKKYCNCWFVEEEESELQSNDEEEQTMNKVCRWNTCFKTCMNSTNAVRATCKANCKCWFLENEQETVEEVTAAPCYYYAKRCKSLGYKYVYCSTGTCSNYLVEQEQMSEVAAAPCYYYARRCKSLGYKYVYCSTGACSNY